MPRGANPKIKKGQAAYDLLNLTYESYQPQTQNRPAPAKRRPHAPHTTYSGSGGGYMLANYRFSINAVREQSTYLKNPDYLVQWTDIHQVAYNSNFEEYKCPICMEYPAAARITKCGHIFCLACVVQYLHGAEKSTCPMCSQFIHTNQLRSVVPNFYQPLRAGDCASFVLVRRPKNSITSYIVTDMGQCGKVRVPVVPPVGDQSTLYNRYSHCSRNDILEQSNRDAAEIRERLGTIGGSPADESEQQARDSLISALTCVEEQQTTFLQDNDTTHEQIPEVDVVSDDCFYTYAAANGQPVFLCPLNMRMLLFDADREAAIAQSNVFEEAGKVLSEEGKTLPIILELPIVQIDWYTMDDTQNRKWKQLRHLPTTSDFAITELDLSTIVSPECVQYYAGQLDNNISRRARDAARDKHEKQRRDRQHRWEVEQRLAETAKPDITTFPTLEGEECDEQGAFWTPDGESTLVSPPESTSEVSTPIGGNSSTNTPSLQPQQQEGGSPLNSLADILSDQQAAKGAWSKVAPASSTLHWGGTTAADGSKTSAPNTPTLGPMTPSVRDISRPWGAFGAASTSIDMTSTSDFPDAPPSSTSSNNSKKNAKKQQTEGEATPQSHLLIDELLATKDAPEQQQKGGGKGKKKKGKTISLTSFQRI